LAADVVGLIDALGAESAMVVGPDWGAVMAWLGAVAAPERIAGVVGMSVPPLRALLRAARPAQLRRSRYMGFFQLPRWAEASLRQGGIERLWRRWSPGFDPPQPRLQSVIATLGSPDSLTAALGYYRSVLQDAWRRPRRWRAGWRMALQPIPGHATVVYGTRDACIAPPAFARLTGCFDRPPTVCAIDAGHFLPTEAPDAVLAILRTAAHDAFMTQR
jgi:pimeloyl-ACP methyl ester carboxylesterase